MRALGFLGALVVAATLASVVSTFIVPRDTPARIAGFIARVFMPAYRALAKLLHSYEAKDHFLAYQAPMFLFTMLVVWLVLLLFGFGALVWAVTDHTVFESLREAGSSLLTLGFYDTPTPPATVVDLAAALSGLVVLALLIGYLPVLYGAFNRREITVTMLESRAGAPAWGPEILWRHQRIGILDNMPAFYSHWERWCADVAETHSSYPMLLFFRSPDPLRSWLTGLIAVLDSAALYNALCPQRAPSEARLCLRMGFLSLQTVGQALGIAVDPDPLPDAEITLTYEEYISGVERLVDIEFPMERTPEEAWPHFRGWRVNYESVALRLADTIVATPGPWSGKRSSLPGLVIGTRRPVDRTPDEPEGTKYTRPSS